MRFGRKWGTDAFGHNKENYRDLQPIAQSMKPTLWVPSENLSFGFPSKVTGYSLSFRTITSSPTVVAIFRVGGGKMDTKRLFYSCKIYNF